MDYQQIVDYLKQAQVPHREQDGKIQVLDFSQLPWAMRSLFTAQGYVLSAPLVNLPFSLAADTSPALSGDLDLNSHMIKGTLISDELIIDGGLM